MTLTHLHGEDLHRATGDRQSAIARVAGDLCGGMSAIYRSIMAAKLRLFPSEPTFHAEDGGESSPQDDPARYPQWPLILCDKWDF